jgi:hypothetical protein
MLVAAPAVVPTPAAVPTPAVVPTPAPNEGAPSGVAAPTLKGGAASSGWTAAGFQVGWFFFQASSCARTSP